MSNHRFSPVSQEESCCNLSTKAKICLGIVCVLVVVAIIGVVVGVLKGRQAPKHKEWEGNGTTLHFPEIVLGRCYTYTQVLRPEMSKRDCQEIAKAFMNAFRSKDPCSTTEQDYQLLMKLTNQTVPCDKTLFWSKSKELAHQYTKVQQEMFTLEDTLLGYIADGLQWCGDAASSELNYDSCPSWKKDCANNTVSIFWDTVSKRPGSQWWRWTEALDHCELRRGRTFTLAKLEARFVGKAFTALHELMYLPNFRIHWSFPPKHHCSPEPRDLSVHSCFGLSQFAENACGGVQVVLNGSISDTFNKNSTFGRVEIYHLNPEKVSSVQAWVMHNIGDHSNSCSSSSIKDLKLILSERHITFTCHDNYRPIRFLQCVKNTEHSSCQSAI